MIDQTVFNNKKAAYYTLGCKLNFAETSTIGKLLAEQGVRKVRPGEKADICVVNTCSVTELADKKCRQAIRRISKQHPGAFIVVTGCYAQLKPEEVSHIDKLFNKGRTYFSAAHNDNIQTACRLLLFTHIFPPTE